MKGLPNSEETSAGTLLTGARSFEVSDDINGGGYEGQGCTVTGLA